MGLNPKTMITLLIHEKQGLNVYDLELAESEYEVIDSVLRWLRNNSYGSLEIKLNTHEPKVGIRQKIVDICPTTRQRIIVQ